MFDRRDRYEETAQQARADREGAEQDIARAMADEIRDDIAGFDPKRLRGLGPAGLRTLVAALGISNEHPDSGRPDAGETEADERTVPPGWAHLRVAEPSPWLTSVAFGALIGALIVILGGLARLLVS
ncbi:hypothetical protein [Aureimonas leprariae]|uniref:Uncharacterized protein n=1 Tax=Plantimonas leprariae TaxID=2615207 RepID=A0A7V7TYY9_9HYPH|nr:hypothetical protein [Aureimonas leprariae]KAB0678443.1 hypothetical protein F6X38_15515 [Aureimonas leprariae]